jgi:hypothetical protein
MNGLTTQSLIGQKRSHTLFNITSSGMDQEANRERMVVFQSSQKKVLTIDGKNNK